MTTKKRVKRDSKTPAAGKLAHKALETAMIFTPTAEQPKDPNAKPTKKPGMVITQAMRAAAIMPGPGNDRYGSAHAGTYWYARARNS